VRQEIKINEQETVFANAAESIVSLEDAGGKGRGTGFVVAKDNKQVIITNAHVCEINLATPIFVVYHRIGSSLRAPLRFPGAVIKRDESHDLCMVSIPFDLKVKSLSLADDIHMDTSIYIIGYPSIALLSSSNGFVRGYHIIDQPYPLPIDLCVGRKHYIKTVPIKQENGKNVEKKQCFLRANFLFTDALGDKGQSGSPGLNADGEVIGVMSMIGGNVRPFASLVPLSSLKKFLSTN
jgi:S1-C subfamily serine protease